MVNEIENMIKVLTGTVNGFIVQFSGNNGNVNRSMDARRGVQYIPRDTPSQPTGIKFSSMGPSNVRLSPVVHDSNPVVNGIKFSSD